MKHPILLVDDNLGLLLSLKQALSASYDVEVAQSGTEALSRLAHAEYRCVLLDLSLPDMTGLEVCTNVRRSGDSVPIIIVSGDGSVAQKATLLDAGADDYLTKPANLVELQARIRTTIRRARTAQSLSNQLTSQGVSLDSARHTVERDGKIVDLRPKEFALLECMMNNADRVVSRPTLLAYAWDDDADVWTNVVDVHIKYLRDKLDVPYNKPLIKTVHGLGYKFDASKVANITKGGTHYERVVTNGTD